MAPRAARGGVCANRRACGLSAAAGGCASAASAAGCAAARRRPCRRCRAAACGRGLSRRGGGTARGWRAFNGLATPGAPRPRATSAGGAPAPGLPSPQPAHGAGRCAHDTRRAAPRHATSRERARSRRRQRRRGVCCCAGTRAKTAPPPAPQLPPRGTRCGAARRPPARPACALPRQQAARGALRGRRGAAPPARERETVRGACVTRARARCARMAAGGARLCH
jgi:hypothetical protein